jgi:hypothetical protein
MIEEDEQTRLGMEKSTKRGKIPQADWPLIMERYQAGETLASIARTYDCSPPAISYIVSRSREQPAAQVSAPPATEPQLVKTHGNGEKSEAGDGHAAWSMPSAPAAEMRRETAAETWPARAVNGGPAGPPPLSSSNGNGNGNGNGHANGGHGLANGTGHAAAPAPGRSVAPGRLQSRAEPPQLQAPRVARQPFAMPAREANPFDMRPAGRPIDIPEPPPRPLRDDGSPRKDGAAIDHELRNRIDGDIAAFLAAFDAALAEDTQASRFGLREAADRLLRAGARTVIELERLEARVPLAPR